jgi:hypothetical protein
MLRFKIASDCLRIAGFALFIAATFTPALSAPGRAECILDEIKVEALKRAQNGMYPMIGLDRADVDEAFKSIETRDKDEGAAASRRWQIGAVFSRRMLRQRRPRAATSCVT